MPDVITCWVKKTNGKYGKFKSKDGKSFVGPDKKSYNAPVAEKNEVLDFKTFWGSKQLAFYKEGQENPIPLSRESKWKEQSNHDSDVDMLVKITRQALLEAAGADMKQNLTLGAVALVLVFLFIERLFFG
jgi:hypothetical protein